MGFCVHQWANLRDWHEKRWDAAIFRTGWKMAPLWTYLSPTSIIKEEQLLFYPILCTSHYSSWTRVAATMTMSPKKNIHLFSWIPDTFQVIYLPLTNNIHFCSPPPKKKHISTSRKARRTERSSVPVMHQLKWRIKKDCNITSMNPPFARFCRLGVWGFEAPVDEFFREKFSLSKNEKIIPPHKLLNP